MNRSTPGYAIRPLVPEAVYTDRQEFIDYFYNYALEAVPRRAMSTVLLGWRRMGKTEIFKLEKLKDFEGREYFERERPLRVYLWLFAYSGVTAEAERLLRKHQVYWSTRADLEVLIQKLGLRRLPDDDE